VDLFVKKNRKFHVSHYKISQFLVSHWKSSMDFSVTTLIFFALHTITIRLGSNSVKPQVWKDKNTLRSKYVINIFEHLNDFKWKTQN